MAIFRLASVKAALLCSPYAQPLKALLGETILHAYPYKSTKSGTSPRVGEVVWGVELRFRQFLASL